jgi:hypothetical protein
MICYHPDYEPRSNIGDAMQEAQILIGLIIEHIPFPDYFLDESTQVFPDEELE